MKILKKYLWNDGDILPVTPEVPEENTDPINKWRGGSDRLEVYREEKQEIMGFGGAFTESSAYNYAMLSPEEKQKALALLFSKEGLHYNFCRLSLGSCDFSLDDYAYVEEGDDELKTFSIDRDRKYVIPFIKDAMAYTGGQITLLASPWSPPAFMKTNGELIRGGQLKKEYYGIYAKYIRRFFEEYDKEGIRIDYLTPMNEPRKQRWQSCEFSFEDMAEFIATVAQELDRALPWHVNILCWDFNRGGMYPHAKTVFERNGDRVCGTAFHWYAGPHLGELHMMHEFFPKKLLVETEFCHGLGSRLYGQYRTEYLDVLDNYTSAVIEWNLMLDEEGGPYFARDIGCNTPVYRTADNRVEKRGIYSQSYLFAHFIEKGARVLFTSSGKRNLMTLAVKNPDGKILLYIYNSSDRDDTANVFIDDIKFSMALSKGCLALWELAD